MKKKAIGLMTRLPPDLHARLVKSAKSDRHSLNSEIIERVKQSYGHKQALDEAMMIGMTAGLIMADEFNDPGNQTQWPPAPASTTTPVALRERRPTRVR
jgi:hypothetical protein